MRRWSIAFALFFLMIACGKQGDPSESYTDGIVRPGDILISSNTADDLVAYLHNENLFKQITFLDRAANRVQGVGFMKETNELLIAVDGKDDIIAMNIFSGEERDLITSSALNGNLYGVTQLESSDILVIESNNLERFDKNGFRITSGWPLAINTPYQVAGLSAGGFIVCAGGSTDEIRIYDDDGNIVAQDSGPGGHDATGCAELPNKKIAVSWAGANDQIWLYESDLSSGQKIFDNASSGVMPYPRAMGALPNGNIIFADYTYHHLVEIKTDGTFVRKFGVLHDTISLFVVPSL